MKIFVPCESDTAEPRVPIIPDTVKKLAGIGAVIAVERGLGKPLGVADDAYTSAGASLQEDRATGFHEADLILRLNPPSSQDVALLQSGAVHISFLNPFQQRTLLEAFAGRGVSAVAMEFIPRTTLAQKMDALSSQASLAGYVAVILAAERLKKIFPMMMTPAGTIAPARVFVIGAGVAGLQAIATAKRLGARVDAFDTRPAVAEQVESLGGKFLKVDLGETGETKEGYARSLTEEQLARQREAMAKACESADVVIAAAQVFGKKAPVIVTRDIIKRMKPGSVIVDTAVESGGNVEGVRRDEEIETDGVRIIGFRNLAGHVPVHASQVYSSNLSSFVEHFWDKEKKTLRIDLEDEIMKSALVTHEGKIVNERLKEESGKRQA